MIENQTLQKSATILKESFTFILINHCYENFAFELSFYCLSLFFTGCLSGNFIFSGKFSQPIPPKHHLAKASREDKNGWIYLHLEGSPSDIGYQHGYLAAGEIDTSIQAVAYTLLHTKPVKDWSFYRQCCAKAFYGTNWTREYKDEINGIVEGLTCQKQTRMIVLILTAFNAMEELRLFIMCHRCKTQP